MSVLKIDEDSPQVRIPPPLFLIASIVGGKVVDMYFPRPLLNNGFGIVIGWFTVLVGISIIVMSFITFRRAQTAIEPWKESKRLTTMGLFAVSRNPIYVAFLFIGIGASLLDNNLWILILQIPLALVLYWYVIRREERYLESKFGDVYRDYCRKVRRWV